VPPAPPLNAMLPAETLRSWIGEGGKKLNVTVYVLLDRLNVAESLGPGVPRKFQLGEFQSPPKGLVQMNPLAIAADSIAASMPAINPANNACFSGIASRRRFQATKPTIPKMARTAALGSGTAASVATAKSWVPASMDVNR